MAKQSWLAPIRPHLDAYFSLPRGQREPFALNLASQLGLRVNTVQRQLLAAQYLRENGLEHVTAPLLSVEAVARVGKYNRRQELALLKSLAEGAGDTEFYRQQAEAAAQQRFAALSHLEPQSDKTFTLWDAIDFLRTISADHLLPLRSSLTVSEQYFSHRGGLIYVLRALDGRTLAVFNLPFRSFSRLNAEQTTYTEMEIYKSISSQFYTIVFCPFDLEFLSELQKRINERNRPYFFRINGTLTDKEPIPLGHRFPELERPR